MNIGLFCDTYPLELDGVGVVVKNYAREFVQLGYNCRLIVPRATKQYKYQQNELPCPILQYGGVTLPVARQYRAGIPYLDAGYVLRRRERLRHLDILHAHTPFGGGMEAVRLSRIYDVPLIGTFHSKFYDDFYNVTHSETLSQVGVKLVLNFFNACDEVWAVNHATADVLRSYGYAGDITVMQNGTDPVFPSEDDKRRAAATFGIDVDRQVLLYVGQQNWKKNIRRIVDALALYKHARPDFQMVMAGQGPHMEEIQAYVKAKGLQGNFLFTGQIMERVLLSGLYACADLLLFPSLYDNASMVVNEAAASGTPALLIRGSCTAECIDAEESNGFLCEDDAADIANTLMRIMPDKERLRRTGELARETIPVSWQVTIARVLDRYENLIDSYDARALRV